MEMWKVEGGKWKVESKLAESLLTEAYTGSSTGLGRETFAQHCRET
ncbi:MAG: hypothetical protein MAG451_03164 [Anaerolineales bacterium]|nr:hypothetical protein [Anaerolineales bacterium]